MELHLAVTFAVVLVLGVWAISGMRNAPARTPLNEGKAPLVALPTRSLMPLCVIGIAAFLVEGAGSTGRRSICATCFQSSPSLVD
ncbi:hypothetical protein GGE66_005940 [Rhizobium leguminosarum]|uniref:Uncharacterized protein n=1 Tax=Rhizobium leguminosarum TaxID=384 RepID=A0A7X0A0D5_RHILE|nr:hypothetical protein [Rhizobium leguminosarum]